MRRIHSFSAGCRAALMGVAVLILLLGELGVAAATALQSRQWVVEGVTREALVHVPSVAAGAQAPLVFGFHGHGGSMQNAARSFDLHTLWPEAIVVYPQGLKTPGQITDPEGRRNGWQRESGDQGDRDLKFFDAVLASLKKDCAVDSKRIYATGHSNGGAFTYLLWAARGETFAAMAPSGAAISKHLLQFKPKPVLHLAGQNDPLVRFAWQDRTIEFVRKLNQCGEAQPWEGQPGCKFYTSQLGDPVVTYIHAGGHSYPSVAPALIVKFFKQQHLP